MTLIQKLKILIIQIILRTRYNIICFLKHLLFHPKQPINKILIHRIGTFGDSIVALPALSLIRQTYPNAQIDFVSTYATPLNLSAIIEKNFFHTVYLFDKYNRKKELKTLQHNQYDLYIEIPQNYGLLKTLRNMLIVRFFLKIHNAFGWDEGMTKLFAKEQLSYLPPLRESERFIRNLKREGIEGSYFYPLRIENPPIKFNHHAVIALVIGTNVPANIWPLEFWRYLATSLHQKGFILAIIGGENEIEKANTIAQGLENVYNFCGKFSVAQSAGFLQQYCRAAICHDTGAMHLAYAVNIPLIALFSSRQLSSKWFPPQSKSIILINILSCSGCFRKRCDDNICMKEIMPITVEMALEKIISQEIDNK